MYKYLNVYEQNEYFNFTVMHVGLPQEYPFSILRKHESVELPYEDHFLLLR